MKRIVSEMMIIAWILAMVTGCDQKTTEIKNSEIIERPVAIESEKVAMLEGQALTVALTENLLVVDVAILVDTLQDWGYNYRQENSIVLTQNRYRRVSVDELGGQIPAANAHEKVRPDCGYYEQYVGTDTLVWQVFENSESDSSRHTALMTLIRDGQNLTCLQEFAVSESPSEILLFAGVQDGILVHADSAALAKASDYWKEFLACCGGCAVGCWLSGPGYAHCVGVCCAACAAGAIIHIVLNWFW